MSDDQGMHKCPGCGGWGRNGQSCRPCHDTDHAVALERGAVIKYLQREMQGYYDLFEQVRGTEVDQERGIALDLAWQAIANGEHWEAGR